MDWRKLPSAAHIERILQTVTTHHSVWRDSYYKTVSTLGVRRYVRTYNISKQTMLNRIINNVDVFVEALRSFNNLDITGPGRNMATNALQGLIAYPDSMRHIVTPWPVLRSYVLLSDSVEAFLVLPAVYVFNTIDGVSEESVPKSIDSTQQQCYTDTKEYKDE